MHAKWHSNDISKFVIHRVVIQVLGNPSSRQTRTGHPLTAQLVGHQWKNAPELFQTCPTNSFT